MRRTDYDAFTRELTARLEELQGVIGLVAVGSMAGDPDEWSDHDFFVVTEGGRQEQLRQDVTWLPDAARIVLAFRETDHGLKVVYDDGHLLEFAVFDLEELGLAAVNRRRVLLDRGGVTARVEDVAAATAARPLRDDHHHFAMFVSLVLVGGGRVRRGERLSGERFRLLALEHLLTLLGRARPAPQLDDLDPFRRFELAHPALGAELASATTLQLLAIAERELRPNRPELAWGVLEVVRRRLD